MSLRKVSLQEFQHQIKDVRGQLVDQVKCLEQRTDVQVNILHEVNDFLKKRAEIDLEYSKQLDKLVKSVMLKHKNEKQKRSGWSIYSTCSLWQQLVDDTKDEARQRSITAEVYGTHIASSILARCTALQKISKRVISNGGRLIWSLHVSRIEDTVEAHIQPNFSCREIGVLAQGEVIRVIDELFTAMKTYQTYFAELSVVSTKLQQAEAEKSKTQDSNSARKQRSVQKNLDKKSAKFEASRLKCDRARNEYLLAVDAANASLHKFFADDLSDLIDCTDLGMEYWLNLILTNIISARKAACQTEMNSLANLSTFKDSLQPQLDKQKFFESNSSIFMLPKRFEFKCDSTEQINTISLDRGLSTELKQRHYQIRKRLERLRIESDESWQILEQTEQRVRDLLSALTLVEISEHGIADNRLPEEAIEAELTKVYEFYLPTFRFYLLNSNLIVRLESRADSIGAALIRGNISFFEKTLTENGGNEGGNSNALVQSADVAVEDHISTVGGSNADWHEQARRKKRLGSQASAATADSGTSNSIGCANGGAQFSPLRRRRPRLFGGSLEEYVELTGEKIPIVVTSCIRVLSQFALHHQGVFRVSGSQVEINNMKEMFENGDDPLRDVQDASDVNSIAGVLKLYFRELREPLFPFYLFDLLTDCAKCSSTIDFINQISSLLSKLPRPNYLLLRYLFAFLNHLSEFCDENMMDPYNLAICFGPTLLPIPEGKDQVYYQTYVNEVVKNLIVHHDLIFAAPVAGPRYEKYNTTARNADNSNDVELYMDDADEYFGSSSTPAGTNTATGGVSIDDDQENGGGGGSTEAAIAPLSSADFFDYRNYANEMLGSGNGVSFRSPDANATMPQPLSSLFSINAMDASTCSIGSLGFNHYSECLPPSITATLLKPTANSQAKLNMPNNNPIFASVNRAKRSANTSIGWNLNERANGQKDVVVEESNVDSFLKGPSNGINSSTEDAALLLRQKLRLLQSNVINEGEKTNSAPIKHSVDLEGKARNESTDTTHCDGDGLQSRSSQHSRGSSDGNGVRIRARDPNQKCDPQKLPPPSPQQKQQTLTENAQYSQILSKSERIRIPMVPASDTKIAPNDSTIARQKQQGKQSQQQSFNHNAISNYGSASGGDVIPPSYDVLYGGDRSTLFRTLANTNVGIETPNSADQMNANFISTLNTSSTVGGTISQNASNGNYVSPTVSRNGSAPTSAKSGNTSVLKIDNTKAPLSRGNSIGGSASSKPVGVTTVTSSRQVVVNALPVWRPNDAKSGDIKSTVQQSQNTQ